MEFSHKIIAYLDILGWKQLVKSAEDGTGPPLAELLSWLECLGTFWKCTKRRKSSRFSQNG
jgi:hypothetical protein